MPPRRTPNPAAAARRDLDELVTALFDKLETADPAWAASHLSNSGLGSTITRNFILAWASPQNSAH